MSWTEQKDPIGWYGKTTPKMRWANFRSVTTVPLCFFYSSICEFASLVIWQNVQYNRIRFHLSSPRTTCMPSALVYLCQPGAYTSNFCLCFWSIHLFCREIRRLVRVLPIKWIIVKTHDQVSLEEVNMSNIITIIISDRIE